MSGSVRQRTGQGNRPTSRLPDKHHTRSATHPFTLTKDAVAPLGVKPRDAERSKNFFALGLISWMYTRPTEPTLTWIDEKFAKQPQVAAANRAAFATGHAFGETAELFESSYSVRPAKHEPGTYTNITGNTALAWGLVAAGQLARLPVFLGGYPITPASDILHELSKHKSFGIRTLQAEDEIAGIGAAKHVERRRRGEAIAVDALIGRLLPRIEQELERQLGVDVHGNLMRYKAVRAGFSKSGISRFNRMVERPMFRNGQVVARQLINLSSSFDHRVVDGMDAAQFIQAMRALLETPALLFVE